MDIIPQEYQTVAVVQLAQADAVSVQAKLVQRAKADGWSPSQADWIGKIGLAALNGELNGSEATFDTAYRDARRILAAGYFDNALQEGKSRLVAFLTVIDLERQVAERAGNPVPRYSEEALKIAYAILATAADRGASTADQIELAFASLRAQATPVK